MSQFTELPVKCQKCRRVGRFVLPICLNARRVTRAHDDVLRGRLNVFRCPKCGTPRVIDASFIYYAPDLGFVARVVGRDGTPVSGAGSASLLDSVAGAEPKGKDGPWVPLEVHGMGELREQVVRARAKISVNELDEVKAALAVAAARRRAPSATLCLVKADARAWTFGVTGSPRSIVRLSRKSLAEIRRAVAAPHDAAPIVVAAAVAGGPGSAVAAPPTSGADRRAVNSISRKLRASVSARLIERLGQSGVDRLCALFRDLPYRDAKGNRALNRIEVARDYGGALYDFHSGVLRIGDRLVGDLAKLTLAITHEIGHSVHDEFHRRHRINRLLERDFGWRMFDLSDTGIDGWVKLFGPWPWSDEPTRARWRRWIRTSVRTTTSRPMTPTFEARPIARLPGGAAVDPNISKFGPFEVISQSLSNWYVKTGDWIRRSGRAFAVNYYYGGLMAVDEATLALVEQPDSPPAPGASAPIFPPYAAMSPLEFFAEAYARIHAPTNLPHYTLAPIDCTHAAVKKIVAVLRGTPGRRSKSKPSFEWAINIWGERPD